MPTEKSCGSGSETQLVPTFLHKYLYQDKLLSKQADFASNDTIDGVLPDQIIPLKRRCTFSRILYSGGFGPHLESLCSSHHAGKVSGIISVFIHVTEVGA